MHNKGRQAQQSSNVSATQAGLRTAQMFAAQGKLREAEDALKSVVRSDPACAIALYKLGVFAAQREETQTARDYFTKALKLAPQAPELLLARALLHLDEGQHDEAVGLAEQAAALTASPETMTRIGTLLREAGVMDRAQQMFERALKAKPGYVPALYGLRPLIKFTAESDAFRQLLALDAQSARLPPPDKIHLAFTLGKAFLDQGEDDKAFAQFAKGNQLKKETLRGFDISQLEQYAENIIHLFDKKIVEEFTGTAKNTGERAVFIVGMPRSGSTLVDQIVSSHPQAISIDESKALRKSLPLFANAELPQFFAAGQPSMTKELIEKLSPEMLEDIAEKYASFAAPLAGDAQKVVDKMLFNYLWVGIIRLAMPAAKIIHCTRNPADIGLSLWQLYFPVGMPWVYDQQDIGRYYLAYRKVMAHWNKLFPGNILEINYETMVAHQERETRRLLDFCGLPWDDKCRDFHLNTRRVTTASATQVRNPIYASSVEKWKKYEKHLGTLIKALEKQT